MTELGIRARYLHSEIETLERMVILRDLRLGKFDVLVGINLLREGLDLPEVSLVAILDADKEGFLRSETSLIQTIGRAARNIRGRVLMFADKMTNSMDRAIKETNRRRTRQLAYNEEHGITPETVQKAVRDLILMAQAAEEKVAYEIKSKPRLSRAEIEAKAAELERSMLQAARNLDFEKAAEYRDEMREWQKLM